MTCRRYQCPECEDSLIHLKNRGPDESSSPLGQYVHDHLPNTFYWMDSDGIIYKKATQIFRLLEHKFRGQSIANSQLEMLPKMARMIAAAAAFGTVERDQSGCFVLWSDDVFSEAVVQRVKPGHNMELGPSVHLGTDELAKFLSGDYVSLDVRRVEHNLGVVDLAQVAS